MLSCWGDFAHEPTERALCAAVAQVKDSPPLSQPRLSELMASAQGGASYVDWSLQISCAELSPEACFGSILAS